MQQTRINAPRAFRQQLRCVTEQDYVKTVESYPDVQSAAATLHWNGSWNTMMIAVQRAADRALDSTFRQGLIDYLEGFRLIGYDINVISPNFIALDLAFVVQVNADTSPDVVKRNLEEHFSNIALNDDEKSFFHPAKFGFGQSVYLSEIISEIMSIPGVAWVDITSPQTRFQRFDQPSQQPLSDGFINIGHLDIARLRNDPALPGKGLIEFIMEQDI